MILLSMLVFASGGAAAGGESSAAIKGSTSFSTGEQTYLGHYATSDKSISVDIDGLNYKGNYATLAEDISESGSGATSGSSVCQQRQNIALPAWCGISKSQWSVPGCWWPPVPAKTTVFKTNSCFTLMFFKKRYPIWCGFASPEWALKDKNKGKNWQPQNILPKQIVWLPNCPMHQGSLSLITANW